MFLYVVIFQQMKYFFAFILIKYDKINGKKYHKPETTEIFFRVPGVLFCTAFNDYQIKADWLVY